MRKHRLLLCVVLCLVFQLAGVTFASAKEDSQSGEDTFWEDNIYYHVVAPNEVEPVAMDQKYAEEQGYILSSDNGTSADREVTFVYPSSVVHDGVTYTITKLPDYKCSMTYAKGELKIIANAWGNFSIASEDLKIVWGAVYLNSLTDVTKIVLPDTLYYIGTGSLVHCDNLKEIEFAKSYDMLVFGDYVFCNNKMSEIVLPEGTSKLGNAALGYIPRITIPASVVRIGSHVVNYMTQKVTIDSKNKKFKMKDGMLYSKNEKVLYGASAKVKSSVTISAKTEEIRPCTFAYSKVKKVKLSTKVTRLTSGVFANCHNLIEVTGTGRVKSIADSVFGYCYKLKSIGKLPKLHYIGKAAFWGCDKLNFKPGKKVKIAKKAFTVNGK